MTKIKKSQIKETLAISEKQFQEQVIDLAHIYGWWVAHFRPARVIKNGKETWRTAVSADGAGFLDLVMLRPPRIIIAELKSETGKMTPEQEKWFKLWEGCKHTIHFGEGFPNLVFPELYLWRPSQIDDITLVLH